MRRLVVECGDGIHDPRDWQWGDLLLWIFKTPFLDGTLQRDGGGKGNNKRGGWDSGGGGGTTVWPPPWSVAPKTRYAQSPDGGEEWWIGLTLCRATGEWWYIYIYITDAFRLGLAHLASSLEIGSPSLLKSFLSKVKVWPIIKALIVFLLGFL